MKANGIGLGGLLFVLFVGLKLTGHIAWSWWWVALPLWAPLGIFLAIMAAVAIVAGVAWALDK